MACLFQVTTRHETLAADKQSLAPSTFLLATVEISGVKHAHLLGGSPNPNLISETFISKGLLFFFQPSLQTGSSDINPPLSFRPYMFNPSPRDELPPTAISSLLTYIISPRFQFMSSNHNTSGKHNLGLKRIENPSFTTYPKSFAIALYVLSSVPQCLLLPPIVFPH
ncbi:uncharacterized protein N7525_000486, partial [Penicillium rubens]|uniref:uncharacterized protein n=1 Tax=Penicillium rubens TaxID=1108849 RepID=UPI002A5A4AAF